jgi:protein gp37
MGINSKIEWTDHTANLWHGCTKVHEGCDNCYACNLSKRYGNEVWGNDKPRRAIKDVWSTLNKLQKAATEQGVIHTVFVGSMMDIFEKPMPLIDHNKQPIDNSTTKDLRDRFFNEVVPNSPNLRFLLLTKRPSNINKYIPENWKEEPPSNVMFGTSPVNQSTFDKLVPQLRQINGKRFLSVEPQLDDIENIDLTGIDWVIQGGESGHHKRPFNTDWARRMKDYCKDKNLPYFFKQIDKVQEIPDDLMIRELPF